SPASSLRITVNMLTVTPPPPQPRSLRRGATGVIMATVSEKDRTEPKSDEETPAPPPEYESVTEHTVQIGDKTVAYRAVAGTTPLRSEEGEPRASIFSIAYTRTGPDQDSARPLTFVFNGGPGSSSTWLHLGLVGPRRVEVPDGPTPPAAPYRVIDN